MVESGMTPAQIAQEFGCKLSTLKVYCSKRRISLSASPQYQARRERMERGEVLINLSARAMASLNAFSAEMGKSRARVAARLLELACKDNLLEAILDGDLDDEEEMAA
jgi:hypothetical protein